MQLQKYQMHISRIFTFIITFIVGRIHKNIKQTFDDFTNLEKVNKVFHKDLSNINLKLVNVLKYAPIT